MPSSFFFNSFESSRFALKKSQNCARPRALCVLDESQAMSEVVEVNLQPALRLLLMRGAAWMR